MSGAKETPRQKMIGMMYLVYTALLAMNVSKDILDAFDTVNMGVQETNITLMQQIEQRYATFEEQYTKRPEKYGDAWREAQQLREKTDDIINYIEAIKWTMVKDIEGKTFEEAVNEGLLKSGDTTQYNGRKLFNINTAKIKSRDNYNKPTAYMMGDPEGTGKAFELSKIIQDYRREIVKIMGEEHANEIGLVTDSINGERIDYAPDAADNLQKGWEYHNFHHTVLIADITLLNKIISEIETAELNALIQLAHDVTANDFTFENIKAQAFAESNYILAGQPYHAQAMVIASQSTQITAKVRLDGGAEQEYVSNSQGIIDLNFKVGQGLHKYVGSIEMFDPKTNEKTDYTFENTFTVAPPAVSVSAVKMNVVYAGIDNPIAIGGGVGGDITATATGATLTRTGNGTYNLRVVGNPTEVTVNVSSQGSSLGKMTFRVKDLPKPIAKIDNVGADGKVTKNVLLAAGGVRADMGKDFFFDGIKYDVVGYTVKYTTKGGTVKEEKVTGDKFSENLKKIFKDANPGDFFMFTAIRVKGNDNKEKVLDTQIGVEIK